MKNNCWILYIVLLLIMVGPPFCFSDSTYDSFNNLLLPSVAGSDTGLGTDLIKTIDQLNAYNKIIEQLKEKEEEEKLPEPEDKAESAPLIHDSQRSIRNAYARIGDNIDITLPGKGWIYTGTASDKTGIEFTGRNFDESTTSFKFQVNVLGNYILRFQKQDLQTGTTEEEEFHISVLSNVDFLNAVESGPVKVTALQGSGDYTSAERMVKNGRIEDGYNEYLKEYKAGSAETDQIIASLAFILEKYDAAKQFWEKNRKSEKYRNEAISGLFKVSIALEDQKGYDDLLLDFLNIDFPEKPDILVKAALFQEKQGNLRDAASLLKNILDGYKDCYLEDFVCFKLGNIYETSGIDQNIKKAVDYYKIVRDKYPISLYWEKSVDRIDYLNRHFLELR